MNDELRKERAAHLRHRILEVTKHKVQLEAELQKLVSGCNHQPVEDPISNRGICTICGAILSPWCSKSPNGQHDFERSSSCVHCGESWVRVTYQKEFKEIDAIIGRR